jgi:hypothetical protein
MLGNSVFRFNHPQEAEMLREMNQVYLICSTIKYLFNIIQQKTKLKKDQLENSNLTHYRSLSMPSLAKLSRTIEQSSPKLEYLKNKVIKKIYLYIIMT